MYYQIIPFETLDSVEGTTCQQESLAGRVWEETPANGERILPCSGGSSGNLARFCLTSGEWTPVFGSCGMSSTNEVIYL